MVDKLVQWTIGGLVSEMKQHPWTTLVAIAALLLTAYNMNTHADAAEVAGLKTTVTEILAGQIEVKLIDARVRYCEAQREDNVDSEKFYRSLTADYAERYRKATGRAYILPSCAEV